MHKKEFFRVIKKVFIWITVFSTSFYCKQVEVEQSILGSFYYFIFQKKEFDPCDPFYSYYENRTHFFYDENLNQDGTIDYYKLLESRKTENNLCDPLKNKKEESKKNL